MWRLKTTLIILVIGAVALVAFTTFRSGWGPGTTPFDPALHYRRIDAALTDWLSGRPVSPGQCPVSLVGCVAVAGTPGQTTLDTYVLRDGPLAILPTDVPLDGPSYYSWAPVSEFVGGESQLTRWRHLAATMEPLGCEGSQCFVLTDSLAATAPGQNDSIWLCTSVRINGTLGPPSAPCESLTASYRGRTWMRGLAGWGSVSAAEAIGVPDAVEDPGDVAFQYTVTHPLGFNGQSVMRALEPVLHDQPLGLTTELAPAAAPTAVHGVRRYELSGLFDPRREWVRVTLAIATAATELTVVEGRVFVWLGPNTGVLKDYRPAEGVDLNRYIEALKGAIERGLNKLCAQPVRGTAIQCR